MEDRVRPVADELREGALARAGEQGEIGIGRVEVVGNHPGIEDRLTAIDDDRDLALAGKGDLVAFR